MPDIVYAPRAVKLNITWRGQNGDLPDTIPFDATERDIKRIAVEAVRTGYVPGIAADRDVDFGDFVVERFEESADLPARIFLRPKTPFGAGGRGPR